MGDNFMILLWILAASTDEEIFLPLLFIMAHDSVAVNITETETQTKVRWGWDKTKTLRNWDWSGILSTSVSIPQSQDPDKGGQVLLFMNSHIKMWVMQRAS